MIQTFLGRLSDRLPASRLSFVRPVVITVGVLWPAFAAAALPTLKLETATEACSIRELAPALDRRARGRSMTILALADHGPEILYRTRHSVLSIPNHRPQPGFGASYHALTATGDAGARALLARHRVDWILLCPSGVERGFFHLEAAARPTLYERLVESSPPPWLHRLELPASDDDALLYELGRREHR